MKVVTCIKISTSTRFTLCVSIFLLSIIVPQNSRSQDANSRQSVKYVVANVIPVMSPYRQNFEKQLTAAEINQIASIRMELRNIKEMRKKAGIGLGFGTINSEPLTDEQAEVIKETRKIGYKSLFQAMEIADNHEKELQAIFSNEKENIKVWSDELQRIVFENGSKRMKELNPILKRNLQKLFPLEYFSKVLFVIWDPNNQNINNF